MTRRATASLFAAPALLILAIACRDIVAPNRARNSSEPASLQELSGRIVVHPGDMKGWVYYNDQNGTACSGSNCQLVAGPAGQPGGSGSAELAVAATSEGKALILPGYQGVRFDQITTLGYSTYRQTADAGNNLAIALQFNVDYDLDDAASGYQGRLVFEPYVGVGGNVVAETWQTWDAMTGKWWGTRTTVTVNGAAASNPCVQSTPCTWSQLLAAFPDVGVHAVYGAVVLKAGSGWANFRGNVDNITIGVDSVEATYDFELAAPTVVPSEAPDSLPAEYETLGDTISAETHLSGVILRDIVIVQFRNGTTVAEKQEAVEALSGVVVGGRQIGVGEGIYLLRIPTDGTADPVFAAIGMLRSLPAVLYAGAERVFSNFTTYRLSTDGHAANSGAWRLNPDSAFGSSSRRRWALEAINAPFAWGCSSGGGTRIGVFDMDLHAEGEIASSVVYSHGLRPVHTDEHGTHMASIVAANANDGLGTTGVMWNAELALADVSQFNSAGQPILSNGKRMSNSGEVLELLQRLMHEARARVINMSIGNEASVAISSPHTPQQDSSRAEWGRVLKAVVDFDNTVPRPLFVISAGNLQNGSDVYWNDPAGAADSLPFEVIVVTGAGTSAGQLGPISTGQGAIDIAAPGQSVAVSSAAGDAVVMGSSPATAFVAGVAGLLFGFDSTLSAAQVRALLVQGAVSGGRHAGGYPLLDAYESLRLAAGQSGKPLCGNRVWTDAANGLHAQRGSGSEQLFTVGTQLFDATYANVHHGGRRIEMAFGLRYVLNGSTWTAGNWSPDDIGEYSGAFKGSGAWFQDHDDRFGTYITGARGPSSISFEILKYGVDGISADSTLQALAAAPALIDARTTSCVREELNDSTGVYDCVASASEGVVDLPAQWSSGSGGTFTESNVLHALDPQGRFVVVLVGIRRHTSTISATWEPCFGSVPEFPAVRCRGYSANNQVSLRTELYHVDLRTGTAMHLFVPTAVLAEGATGDEVFWLSIDERGEEIAVQVGGISLGTSGFGCTNGRHQWLRFGGSVTDTLSTGHSVSIPGTTICEGALDGGGASAALRVDR